MKKGRRKIIGITGGIGAGKSVVSRILRHQGFDVYDCDLEARRLMESDPCLRDSLIRILGREAYREDGSLDRTVVAKKIFSECKAREAVNDIVHEAVRRDFSKWKDCHAGTLFIESAILSTGGLVPFCSEIWMVDAPVDTRVRRVVNRNGIGEEEVRQRISSQQCEFDMLPEDKLLHIHNGDDDALLESILDLIKEYKD